ncbi:MAG: serine--tRNA ligase [Alphaproteobacteria bacterium]|nr:serine--tRNA ligase [Alphaproteobacteria bacterium]
MHDLRRIRDDAAGFDAALAKRGEPYASEPASRRLLELDAERRQQQTELQDFQKRRNEASKAIGAAKGRGEGAEAERLMSEVADLKGRIQKGEERERALAQSLDELLAGIPNLPADDAPVGRDSSENRELRHWGVPLSYAFSPKDHADLGEALGLMDFEAAARMSGARFVVLKGALARLERALGTFMLDVQREHGYIEISPPILVRDQAAFGTGQLPKFSEDLFRASGDFWLIPTAEVPLTNLVREQILDEEALPLRFTALTPCFRSEAGAAGKDTRGMIRQHQFMKVEIVSIVQPGESVSEHERLTGCAEDVLRRLALPYRVVSLCTGDLGFGAQKTYDLEVWLPGQRAYREISSCSNFGDFQARRMGARFRRKGEKGTHFVHTLNGSGLAVGRTLIAVIENYQQQDGTIVVPDALQPYMGGLERIGPGG